MNPGLIKTCASITVALVALTSSFAHANFVSVGPDSPLNLTGSNGAITVTYSPGADQVWFSNNANGNGDIKALTGSNGQDQDNISSAMESVFSLTSGTLFDGYKVDNAGGGSSATFSSTTAFDYLAVHAGKHEFFFHFSTAIAAGDIFSIETNGQAIGLSNFRSYSSFDPQIGPGPVVPVPAAVWLFGTGIVGLIGFGRRNSVQD